MSSACINCSYLRNISDKPVKDPNYPAITYYYGCGYQEVPPPMFFQQSGRYMFWHEDPDIDDAQKMLLFTNINTTSCSKFEQNLERLAIEASINGDTK